MSHQSRFSTRSVTYSCTNLWNIYNENVIIMPDTKLYVSRRTLHFDHLQGAIMNKNHWKSFSQIRIFILKYILTNTLCRDITSKWSTINYLKPDSKSKEQKESIKLNIVFFSNLNINTNAEHQCFTPNFFFKFRYISNASKILTKNFNQAKMYWK
jgi:hypothetical protein